MPMDGSERFLKHYLEGTRQIIGRQIDNTDTGMGHSSNKNYQFGDISMGSQRLES